MSISIYYASQALGYFYATRVREEYEVSATSTLDQQLANLTSLTQQISETCMYPHQPTPPIHYDYTPRFYQPLSYEPSPPPPQAIPISQGPSLEDLVKSMTISSLQFQETTQASLQNLEIQMSLMAKEICEIKSQKSGEELEVAPQELEEQFVDLTINTQPPIVENAPKVTFHEPIAFPTLL